MINVKSNFVSHELEAITKINNAMDFIQQDTSATIVREIKTSGNTPLYPVSKRNIVRGYLRTNVRFYKSGLSQYKVEATAPYAAAQEAGITRGHVMKHYSTPGTGAHWFQKAIDVAESRIAESIKKAKTSLGL